MDCEKMSFLPSWEKQVELEQKSMKRSFAFFCEFFLLALVDSSQLVSFCVESRSDVIFENLHSCVGDAAYLVPASIKCLLYCETIPGSLAPESHLFTL